VKNTFEQNDWSGPGGLVDAATDQWTEQMSCVTCPKSKGVLGVLNLRIQNVALLMKFVHKFYNRLDIPWVNLVWDFGGPTMLRVGSLIAPPRKVLSGGRMLSGYLLILEATLCLVWEMEALFFSGKMFGTISLHDCFPLSLLLRQE
jgi:hypothetical protein